MPSSTPLPHHYLFLISTSFLTTTSFSSLHLFSPLPLSHLYIFSKSLKRLSDFEDRILSASDRISFAASVVAQKEVRLFLLSFILQFYPPFSLSPSIFFSIFFPFFSFSFYISFFFSFSFSFSSSRSLPPHSRSRPSYPLTISMLNQVNLRNNTAVLEAERRILNQSNRR